MLSGKLISWNQSKGFGFIKVDSMESNIFVHISTLKHMNRAPKVGDLIYFDLEEQGAGKRRAINCRIQGVAAKSQDQQSGSSSLLGTIILIFLLIGGGVFGYNKFKQSMSNRTLSSEISVEHQNSFEKSAITPRATTEIYSCNGKSHCSEMNSCEEAIYYLKNCPGTVMDGDNDGRPCERQWCN